MEKEFKIAIIGSPDAIGGFRAIGVETISVQSMEDCEKKLKENFERQDLGIIFITEDWAIKIKTVLDGLPARALPAVTAIPAQFGSSGVGLANLKKIVEQAVGSDILANE